ncbi:SRPBCC family protein [Rhodococcus sp. ARC_M6]|uniref:SRPBCC family protein n=1 Tax=Rhodococcus sp. ARC_M6 TaxID=2928852 RepID=UPI001FB506BE|nr:SRPBCC family protein [Rhodococcus sp. ARC_M6]MCJ0904700.1 SRPBCC family protein [Rhodococcus sp. ARC_M6]
MPVVEQSVVISRPVAEVWGYLTNADNWPNWENSMVECRQTTDGPLGVGTQWRGVTRILGKRIDWTSEFTEVDVPKVSTAKSVGGPINFTLSTKCEEVEQGTRVLYRLDTESGLGGVFGRMADPLVAKIYGRSVQASLENLADLLDHQASQ